MVNKMRAEFEKWLQDGYNKEWLVSCNGYADPTVDRMWISWQAALSSVVVKLPRPSSAIDYGYELNDIQNTLTDAGIRYE